MNRFLPTLIASSTMVLAAGFANAAELTAYYDFEGVGADRFNDPAGAFADDLVGQFNPAFSADTAGGLTGSQSASFNGNSALFTDAYTTDLGPDPDAWTIMFWIKAADIDQEDTATRLMSSRRLPNGNATGSNTWQIEGFGNPNTGSAGDLMDVRFRNAANTQWTFTNDATNALARADQAETAVWRHVAFVFSNSGHPNDGGAFALTYVDGVQIGSITNPHTDFDGTNIGNNLGQLILGGDLETAGLRPFVGLLDDVALFAGVVDATDIAAIAGGTLSPSSFIVPEPTSLALLGLGGLCMLRRRRR